MSRNTSSAFTGISAANAAKTHTVTLPTGKEIFVHTLTVSTSGADIAADCTIAIKDNAVSVWEVELRAGQLFGGHFDFSSCPIPIRAGDLTVVTDAAGAGCLVTVSMTYEVS